MISTPLPGSPLVAEESQLGDRLGRSQGQGDRIAASVLRDLTRLPFAAVTDSSFHEESMGSVALNRAVRAAKEVESAKLQGN
jgi:hypothetical protein